MRERKMKIGLIQVDGKLPNLALMKLAKWHEQKGDNVTYIDVSTHQFDITYASKIFIGGSGYDLKSELPEGIEVLTPDYDKFKLDYSVGYTSRGCIRNCDFCIVREKEGFIHEVNYDWIKNAKVLLYDNNFLASPKWREKLQYFIEQKIKVCFNQGLDIRLINEENATMLSKVKYSDDQFKKRRLYFAFDDPKLELIVKEKVKLLIKHGIKPFHLLFYVLVGFNTTFEEDYKRFVILDELGCLPFIMIYNRKNDQTLRHFARWVNKRYYKVCSWNEYRPNKRKKND